MDVAAVEPRRVRAARLGVLVLFVGMGLMLGTHVSRVPSVRDALDVSPAQLASLFIAGSIGALLAFSVLGGLVARWGALALLRLAAVATMVGFALMALATHLGTAVGFGVAMFVTLGAFETVNALANAEAATVERLVGRSIMSRFHAAFSLAVLGGVVVGALYSREHVPVSAHYTVHAVLVGAAFLAASRSAVLDGAPAPAGTAERAGGLFVTWRLATSERRTLALGLILFSAFTMEMAANNWLSLTVVDAFGRTEAFAASLYAGFVIAQSAVRFAAVSIVDRLGRATVLRACAVLVAAGASLLAVTPAFWGVPLAFLLWGAGAALGYPLAISAAADERTHATARVAAVAAFGTVSGLTMPQAIGLLAEGVGLRLALLAMIGVAALMFALAPAARPPDTAEGRAEPQVA